MVETCEPRLSCDSTTDPRTARPARPPWRQQLVDVERGMMQGVRGDSVFFVYFFLTSVTLTASFVLEISIVEWTAVILALTLVLSAEMFHQAVRSVVSALQTEGNAMKSGLRMARAAVFVAIVGSVIAICLTLGHAALDMFHGN